MSPTSDDFALFVAVLAEAVPTLAPHQVVDVASGLRALARRLTRYATRECNGVLSEADRTRYVGAEHAARVTAAAYGLTAKVGGDPRGYCLKLILPTKRSNTWGGVDDGWGVPT
jgi:hypothetical protein